MAEPTFAVAVAAMARPPADLLEACWRQFVLGAVQGLTEFLPISSTAHLKVVPVWLGWSDPGVSVTAVIQLGSIAAVLAYFRDDLSAVIHAVVEAARQRRWSDPDARLGIAVSVGTVPILLAGMAIKLWWPGYETSPLRSVSSIGIVSVVMAILLALAEWFGPRLRRIHQVRSRDGLLVGLAQALALIPGVSRSGSTLTASLLGGWQRADAARFSFLLGIPAITLAGLVELKELVSRPSSQGLIPMLVGVVSAAMVSWLAIDWLLCYLQRHSTWIFAAYRLLFGALVLFLAGGGRQ